VCYGPAMPMRGRPTPADALAKALGARLKHLREAQDLRQADVAEVARRLGLNWTSGTVGSIETGMRRLAADELLALPEVLAAAGIQGAFDDVITEWKRTRVRLAQAAALEQWGEREEKMWLEEVGHSPDYQPDPERPQLKRSRREPLPELVEVWGDGEAELAAARTLDVHPRRIALRSWKRWGHSLSDERDRRVAAQVTPDTDRSSIQAARGHITRALIRELGFRQPKPRKRGPR